MARQPPGIAQKNLEMWPAPPLHRHYRSSEGWTWWLCCGHPLGPAINFTDMELTFHVQLVTRAVPEADGVFLYFWSVEIWQEKKKRPWKYLWMTVAVSDATDVQTRFSHKPLHGFTRAYSPSGPGQNWPDLRWCCLKLFSSFFKYISCYLLLIQQNSNPVDRPFFSQEFLVKFEFKRF